MKEESKVTIRLKDKRNNIESNEITIEELIYNQNEIEFEFENYIDEYSDEPYTATCPYKDFLFFQDDYEVIVRIKGKE